MTAPSICCDCRYPHSHLAALSIGLETLIGALFMGDRQPRVFVPGHVLPDGAQIRRVFWRPERDELWVIAEHPSFFVCREGEEVPHLNIVWSVRDTVYPLPTEPGVYP